MTPLRHFRRMTRAGRLQGEVDALRREVARWKEACQAAEEARKTYKRSFHGAMRALEMAWKSNRERDRTIAQLEAELAPYKGHVG